MSDTFGVIVMMVLFALVFILVPSSQAAGWIMGDSQDVVIEYNVINDNEHMTKAGNIYYDDTLLGENETSSYGVAKINVSSLEGKEKITFVTQGVFTNVMDETKYGGLFGTAVTQTKATDISQETVVFNKTGTKTIKFESDNVYPRVAYRIVESPEKRPDEKEDVVGWINAIKSVLVSTGALIIFGGLILLGALMSPVEE